MTREAVVELLFEMYQKRGFVTTDEIFAACEEAELSIFDTDYVSNKVIEKGAFVTDEQPLMCSDNTQANEDELTDYTQTDYSEIFLYFSLNYPSMEFVIDYIKSAKPLQHGEMSQLIMQMRSGNTYAKEIAFGKNMRLALKTAYNYRNKTTISLEDIFQQACLSIMKAIDSYDPYSHSAFTSYCSTWIMQRINRFIMDYENIIRIPIHLQDKLSDIENLVENLPLLSPKETIQIIAEKNHIQFIEAEELLSYCRLKNVLFLDELYEDYNEIPISSNEATYEVSESNELHNVINSILSTIPERESTIIKMRFGIDYPHEYTLAEISSHFNRTRERIRQLETNTLRRLKHPSRAQIIKNFY